MAGLPTKSFDEAKVRKLWQTNRDACILYVNKFYFKIIDPICIIFWCAAEHKYQFIEVGQLKYHMPDISSVEQIGKLSISWNLPKEWLGRAMSYHYTIKLNQPIFFEVNGTHYINQFMGAPHSITETMSQKTQDGVEMIWEHVKKVMCSNNPKVFKYLHDWICNVVCFKRNKTAVYMSCGAGVGKSIFTDFLVDKVLTHTLAHRAEDSAIITDWNALLVAKVLFVLEELPCVTTGEWIKYSNKMKQLITGPGFTRKEKNEKNIEVENTLNFMFLTNNRGIKVDTDDRRYLVLDISSDMKDNKAYFDKLGAVMDDPHVATGFFRYCHEHVNHKFDPRNIPETSSKTDMIIETLSNVLVYVKEEYILKKNDLKCKFSSFYDGYVAWCLTSHTKHFSKIVVAKVFEDNHITTCIGHGNVKMCNMKHTDLLQYYQSKNWMHETDEFSNAQPSPLDANVDEEPEPVDVEALKKRSQAGDLQLRLLNKHIQHQMKVFNELITPVEIPDEEQIQAFMVDFA